MIRRPHHVGVVLHHNNGVAEFAQLFQNPDQAPGVAAVQSDGRLVEHVTRAHEARPQAGGELNALRLAAGKRGRQAVEREVVQPDVVEELQPLADLDENLVGDGGFFRAQLERVEKLLRRADVHAHHLGQVASADAHVEGFLAQPRALAFRTQRVAPVAAQKHAHVQLVLLGFQVVEEAADESVDRFALLVREIGKGNIEAHLAARGFTEIAQPRAGLRLGPRLDRALVERERRVGNDAVHVEIDGVAEPLAARARPDGRVEAEQDRLRLGELHEARLALELLVEAQSIAAAGAFKDHFARLAIADLDGVDQPLMQVRPNGDAVHQHEHRFGKIDIQQRFGSGELKQPASLKEPVEALLPEVEQVIPEGLDGSMIPARKDGVPARPWGQRQQARGDFIHGVLAHARSAFRAEGLAHARIEQAQEVVAFGGGGHRRAGIAAGILLPDGHRRGDAVDVIDLRLFHALEELPRVSRKRFDVAALPLGVDGVEGQRRFPRTGHTRDDG